MTAIAMNTVNPFVHAKSMADASGGNSSGQPSNITANDFLTLLVTEMKNQDPTAQTDPNEYINQLVQVNSLEQLIEINQNLSSAIGNSNNASADHAPARLGSAPLAQGAMRGLPGTSVSVTRASGGVIYPMDVSKNPAPATPGNLGVPVPVPAAQRLAHALSSSR